MTTGAGAGKGRYVHDLALADSDAAMSALIVPFLVEGAARGEPTIAVLSQETQELLGVPLGGLGAEVVAADELIDRPAGALRHFRKVLDEHVAAGASRVRVVNEVPYDGALASWDEWCRYEAAVNVLLADVPVWGRCLYDVRATPEPVLDDLYRTHPFITPPDGATAPNPRSEDPTAFLRSRRPAAPDPVEALPPDVWLTDPSPPDSRRAAQRLAHEAGMSDDAITAIVTAVNEVVTNASVHGRRPVELKAWRDGDRVVATVNDRGSGPQDPFAGLTPQPKEDGMGGFGLWIAHQLMPVLHRHGADGYTVQLATSPPPPQN